MNGLPASPPDFIDSPSGHFADRYQLIRLLGEGGMANVFLAKDLHSREKPVALKILHRELSTDEVVRTRFFRELDLLRRIAHPNVVSVLESGEAHERLYITLEYVHGCSLEDYLENGISLPPAELSVIILGLCDGLSALHALNVIHRDIKPGNILVTPEGLVKLIDLGVARASNSNLTKSYQRVGSMLYMAPEVWLGKPLTPAADLYSLGVVLYELLAGEVPFDHKYPGEIMRMHIEQRPIPLRERLQGVPVWLDALTMRLLEKDPKSRLSSAEEVSSFLTNKAHLHLVSSTHRTKEHSFLAEKTKQILEARTPRHSKQRLLSLDDPRRRTYTLRLNSSGNFPSTEPGGKPRAKTVKFALPKKIAFVVEIERPSMDFFFLGLFLASLQVFDGVLTSMGVNRFGTVAEGNQLLYHLMERYGPEQALIMVKVVAIAIVAGLTFAARYIHWVTNMIAFLSCVYLIAAILPWVYILSQASATQG